VSEDDKTKVQTGGAWLVASQILALEEWRAEFNPSWNSIRKASIWIRFPDLPLEMWSSYVLLRIAARAGNQLPLTSTLKIDVKVILRELMLRLNRLSLKFMLVGKRKAFGSSSSMRI